MDVSRSNHVGGQPMESDQFKHVKPTRKSGQFQAVTEMNDRCCSISVLEAEQVSRVFYFLFSNQLLLKVKEKIVW